MFAYLPEKGFFLCYYYKHYLSSFNRMKIMKFLKVNSDDRNHILNDWQYS